MRRGPTQTGLRQSGAAPWVVRPMHPDDAGGAERKRDHGVAGCAAWSCEPGRMPRAPCSHGGRALAAMWLRAGHLGASQGHDGQAAGVPGKAD